MNSGGENLSQIRLRVLQRFQGDVSNEQFSEWLSQFSAFERPYIEKLTANFLYFSANSVNDAVVELYKKICIHLQESEIDFDSTWFVPVGYVAKSGSLISYMFRKRNDVPHNRFVSLNDLDVARIRPKDTVILLDDFLGSGAQAIEVYSHLSERLPQTLQCRVLLGVLLATERGTAKVVSETKLEPVATRVLGRADMAFSDDSTVLSDEAERQAIFEIVKNYGVKLYPAHPDGFNKSQNLIGFFYSTPNNTLPIYWATAEGWKPLLPRSESFRDPSSLIGPPRFLDRAIVAESSKRPLLDMSQLDELQFDPDVASAAFGEFRVVSIVLTFGKVLTELGVDFSVIPRLISVVRELSELMHEQKFVPSALAICADTAAVKRSATEMFVPTENLGLANKKEVMTVATWLSHIPSALLFDCAGRLEGGYALSRTPGNADAMVPDSLTELAKFTSTHVSIVFYCSAPNRIHLFYKGHRILLKRSAAWHLQASTLSRAVDELARQHAVSSDAIRHAIHLALELSDRNAGAMLTIGDHEAVLKFSDQPKHKFIELSRMQLGVTETGPILTLAAQDGATIMDSKGEILRGMAFLRAPVDVDVQDEVGKGARHSTAVRMSKVTNALVLAVSSDGRITAYSNGSIKFKVMG